MKRQPFGKRLRAAREAQELTQAEAAEKAGITQVYWCNLESGKKINPSLEILVKVAKAVGATPNDLLL